MRNMQIVVSFVLVLLFIGIIAFLLKSELASDGDAGSPASAAPEAAPAAAPKTAPANANVNLNAEARKGVETRSLGGGSVTYELSEDDRKLIEQARFAFKRNAHPQEKIELIDSLAGIIHPDAVAVICMALSEPNLEVRQAAVDLLAEFENNLIVPAVEKALDDKNTEIREEAMNSLMYVKSPDATNLLVTGVSDKAETVREIVFDILEERHAKVQEAVFAKAINSKHADVKERVIDMIVNIPSHNVMEILIEGMKTSDQDYKSDITELIDFFVSEEFDNYDDAKRWWKQNKDNFDKELFEK